MVSRGQNWKILPSYKFYNSPLQIHLGNILANSRFYSDYNLNTIPEIRPFCSTKQFKIASHSIRFHGKSRPFQYKPLILAFSCINSGHFGVRYVKFPLLLFIQWKKVSANIFKNVCRTVSVGGGRAKVSI